MQNRRAFTLVEVLVVIAVVAITTGLLLPALIGAKKQARGTDDLSKLRQLGIGANLYHEQSGDWPRGASDLVNAHLVPQELCSLSNDPTADGLGNEVCDAVDKVPVMSPRHYALPYRNSTIGLREDCVNEDEVSKWLEPGAAGGWLLDFSQSERSSLNIADAYFALSKGKYRRLCYDGSVVTRPFRTYTMTEDGQPASGTPVITFFVDPSEEMLEWLKSP